MVADYDKHCLRIQKSTTIDINEHPSVKLLRIQQLESSYKTWFEYYFPNYAKSECAWFQVGAADALIKNKQIYLLFEVFRSGGKTVHINMGIPLYLYLVKKDLKFMVLMGLTEPKAKRLLSGIQAQLRNNQRILNDYGTRFQMGDWSDGDFSTTDGVRFKSFGFGQDPRGQQDDGQRPDYISVDDSDTKKHLNNDVIMQEAEDFIFEDLLGCFDASDQAVRRFVFANNNFHKKCLTNRIKKRFQEAQARAIAKLQDDRVKRRKQRAGFYKAGKYHILSVPAVKDLKSFEPNWPGKTSAQFWMDLYEEMGERSFCREYMHIHIEKGKIFKPSNMQWKEMLKLDKYDGLVFYGDLSYKDLGDFKGLVLVGKAKRELHIIYTYLRQGSRALVAKWLYDLYEDKRLSRFNIKYKIEGLFAMDEFISDFDNEGDDRGYHIPVTADKRGKANKYERIESIEPKFHRRWVFFNQEEKTSADQVELLDQFYNFEKGSAAHDDGPDCVHGAFDEVDRIAYVEKFETRITPRATGGSNKW
jgi:predicted phage terminase large subunit-like protein